MTAHILLSQIDAQNPTTQSSAVIQNIIRKEIGFEGFLLSDAIEMKALNGSVKDKALKSIESGCDAICYCLAKFEDMKILAETCPSLSDISHKQLDNALKILKNKNEDTNIDQIVAEYSRLMDSVEPYPDDYDATEVLFKLQQ